MRKTDSSIIERLLRIWESVLQVAPLQANANFFDIGGDPSKAAELFSEISRVFAIELPAVMIYHTPTIDSLASIIGQDKRPEFPRLVRLKTGGGGPPLFVTHGVGGSLLDLFYLTKHIAVDREIYGMQAPGIDGATEPLDRIEDMAECFLEEMVQEQPQGPYLLIGYSLGGLVTLEIAQRLMAKGKEIALLAMIDSYPHKSQLSVGQRMHLTIQQVQNRVVRILTRSPASNRSIVPISQDLERYRDAGYTALRVYHPRFYGGRILFVKATKPTDFPADASATWSHMASELLVETVPGDHLEIMTTYCEDLAEVLSSYIGKTRDQTS